MTTIRLDGFLREFGPPPRWECAAPTVSAMLDELEVAFPRLRLKLRDETGAVRRHVRVFVNGEDIRNGAGTSTPLTDRDRVEILHSIQGG
ncbi:MAG TPA: MoaD/ThiS family protein [Thermoplasmata archaeon]|nr:MoaD/ThiS family protein [Thermoplasmata archaeon]